MDDPGDVTLDLVAELAATPRGERRRRLAKLAQPALVRAVELTLLRWETDTARLRRAVETRDERIRELERRLRGVDR